jgi:hypothetical protein
MMNDNCSKVSFLIAGTQKGGTSALDYYLRGHPQRCMADKKEVHFFDNEDYFADEAPNYAAYRSFFKPDKGRFCLAFLCAILLHRLNRHRGMTGSKGIVPIGPEKTGSSYIDSALDHFSQHPSVV